MQSLTSRSTRRSEVSLQSMFANVTVSSAAALFATTQITRTASCIWSHRALGQSCRSSCGPYCALSRLFLTYLLGLMQDLMRRILILMDQEINRVLINILQNSNKCGKTSLDAFSMSKNYFANKITLPNQDPLHRLLFKPTRLIWPMPEHSFKLQFCASSSLTRSITVHRFHYCLGTSTRCFSALLCRRSKSIRS